LNLSAVGFANDEQPDVQRHRILFSGANEIRVSVPDVFVNDDAHLIVELFNDGDASLSVDKLKSSCGCTVPKVVDSKVDAGKFAEMLIEYHTSKPGGLESKVEFEFGGKPFVISSAGMIKRPLLEQSASLILEEHRAKVAIKVADSRHDPTKFTWQCLPSSFSFTDVRVENNEITGILVHDGERFPSSVNLIPFVGKQALAPLGFSIQHRGKIQLITKRIYTQKTKDLRLIVTGDLSSLSNETKGVLRYQGKVQDVAVRVQGNLLFLDNPFEEEGRFETEISVGAFKFPVVVTLR